MFVERAEAHTDSGTMLEMLSLNLDGSVKGH